MNPTPESRLLELYDRVAEAPDAIDRLRKFVLDLAVRGKLVEQNPEDEPAAKLLERIADARPRVEKGSRSRSNKVGDSALTEIDLSLPKGWEIARLSDLVRVVNGRAYKKSELLEEGTPVLRVGNLFTSKHWYYSDLELEADKYCEKGDLIYAWSASFGPFIWNGPRVIYHYHIWKLPLFSEADLSKRFLYLFLQQKTQQIKAAGHGISMVHMTKAKMEQLAVPLPPLPEQHRIVAKVDELMALLDRLETTRTQRKTTRNRLSTASLTRLTAPETTEADFPTHARFTLDYLDQLTSRPEQIKLLRQTILNLAVRGKLVEQDPADEPASELLRRLQAKPKGMTRRNSRRSNVRETDTEPFQIPTGWAWVKVQEVVDKKRQISYGVIKLGPEPKSGGIPTLRCSDVRAGFIDLSGVRNVEERIESEYMRTRLEGGEIVINIRGTLGGVALVPSELKGFNVAREVAVVPIARDLSGSFLVYLMLSPHFWEHVQSNLRGIAYKGLNLGILRDLPIPLPPLAEQHRIVAKVNTLLALCGQLENSLTTADTTRTHLLENLLKETLQPPLDRDWAAVG